MIGRWQAGRLAAGAGPAVVRKALALLGSILQRAAESGRLSANPARQARLDDKPNPDAETAIAAAREGGAAHELPIRPS